MLWSELEPRERRAKLAEVHPDLNEDCLLACGMAVPELAPRIKAQKSKEDKLWVVLRHFGDKGHPQPEGTIRYGAAINGRAVTECPRWEHLPPLDDVEPAKPEVRGEPGRPRVLVTKATLLEIFKQSLERARDTAKPPRPHYQEIADDNGVKRTWVTPIVKWVVGHQQEALHALATSEIPARFSTCVRD